MTDAGKLAKDLLKNGVMGMKIWPFDEHLDKSNGHWITNKELDAGLKPFRQVREAVGNEINEPSAEDRQKFIYDMNWNIVGPKEGYDINGNPINNDDGGG